MKINTICPPRVKFANQKTYDFFNSVMLVDTGIKRRKEHYWFMCERNLLAALLYYYEGKSKPVGADMVKQVLTGGVDEIRRLLGSITEGQPGAWYYNLLAGSSDSIFNSVIMGLMAKMDRLGDSQEGVHGLERFARQHELVPI